MESEFGENLWEEDLNDEYLQEKVRNLEKGQTFYNSMRASYV